MNVDFTDEEITIIKKTIEVRWKNLGIHLADIDITLTATDPEPTPRPAAVWETSDCAFVIIKVADNFYKSLFYYLGTQRFDTGVDKYTDLEECVVALMKVQANMVLSKRTNG